MNPAFMDPKGIRFLTIHCSATPEGRAVSAGQLSEWDKAKFGQTSYHLVVELDGKIVRTLRDDQRGAHTGGHNTGNIGICYVGGMSSNMARAKDTRTPEQRRALLTLVRTFKERYPGIVIRGHRDWPGVHKDCPCFDVTAWLRENGE